MRRAVVALLLGLSIAMAAAAAQGRLQVQIPGLQSAARVPDAYALCRHASAGHTAPGGNLSPPVQWSPGPSGTRSYAIILKDLDAPVHAAHANQEGQDIAAAAPRRDFYHWLLADIPPSVTALSAGQSLGQPGRSNYRGTKPGYQGPCPPWNDQRVHHYLLRVYAVDTPHLNLPDRFTGKQLETALDGHVLAEGTTALTDSTRATSP